MQVNGMQCCGVRELSGLSGHLGDNTAALLSFAVSTYFFKREKAFANPVGFGIVKRIVTEPQDKFRYALFTQAGVQPEGYGFKFAAFIRENNLGAVVETDFNRNPNSGNQVKCWLWTIDHEATKALAVKLDAKGILKVVE